LAENEVNALSYDVIVIGGGPGGYIAAIKCAQANKKVLLVEERERLGGVCLNEGCIPTKAILQSVHALKTARNASQMGFKVLGDIIADPPAMVLRSQKIVDQLTSGLKMLMDINKVEVIHGRAELVGKDTVDINGQVLQGKAIIIASGTVLKKMPVEGAELPQVMYSCDALELKELPEELVIVGAGAIGIEFATIYNGIGSKVTVLEMLPNILPGFDIEMSSYLQELLEGVGIEFYLGAKLDKITPNAVLFTDAQGNKISVNSSKILIAAGRKANISFIKHGKEIINETGNISVNDRLQTKIDNIWAVGDINGRHTYAHVASSEGIVAAENICGKDTVMDYSAIPHVVYTDPELAWTGITEEEAINQGIDYEKALFPLSSNAKALCENYSQGLIKIIAGKKYKDVLGVHILSPHAGELISMALMAIKLEVTAQELVQIIYAHPSVSEIYAEAANHFFGMSLHG
jgi:dihydrolipoamide dehydrogenase